jgi:hypothetical protein
MFQLSILGTSTALGTVLKVLPIPCPLLPPLKFTPATKTDLRRKPVLSLCFHELLRVSKERDRIELKLASCFSCRTRKE